jgi:hypothetical protein
VVVRRLEARVPESPRRANCQNQKGIIKDYNIDMSYIVCAELFAAIAARLAKHAPMPKRIHDFKNEKERGKDFWTGVVSVALEAFTHQTVSAQWGYETSPVTA